jgi:anti-anti-sigma regulatory factor
MLQVREQHHHTTEVLTLTESFDRRITPGIQVLILLAQKTDGHHLILDCSHITNIDSTSFRRFFRWYDNMKSHRVQVSMVKPLAPIWAQFHWWHAAELVQIYATLEEATWNNTVYS